MEENQFVPFNVFMITMAAEMAIHQQTLATVNALATILRDRGIVTPEVWASYVDQGRMDKLAQVVRESAEMLRKMGMDSIEEVLRKCKGPMQ